MATAPAIMTSDPVTTIRRAVPPRPANSPNTSTPHARPHSWFVFDSGMPRPIPMYFAAYC